MKYLEVTNEQLEELRKVCLVRHMSDSGRKNSLVTRMDYYTSMGESFATNLKETLVYRSCTIDLESLEDDNLYRWEYDVVNIPLDRIDLAKDILKSKAKKLELK